MVEGQEEAGDGDQADGDAKNPKKKSLEYEPENGNL